MRIGVFFNARRSQGGLYQYALMLVYCLLRYDRHNEYRLIHATRERLPFRIDAPNWSGLKPSSPLLLAHRALEGAQLALGRLGWLKPLPLLPPFPSIRKLSLDVMLYVKPTLHVALWPFPAVFPIHDLQHLLQPEFPEVSSAGERHRRELVYRPSVKKARAILAESDTGKDDILRCYSVDPGRVHVLPYVAPTQLWSQNLSADSEMIRRRYGLPTHFFFYPAAFWPHKNHALILRALAILKQERSRTYAVAFAGGKSRQYTHLVALARQLGIASQVRFLGYVPDEVLPALYRQALALVMPTFFGPSNIPILEAWTLNCPVITSDIRGIREQVGDAGVLVPPTDVVALAEAMQRVAEDRDLRETLIERGRERVKHWTPADFAARLVSILESAARA